MNKQRYLAELQQLLVFMSEEDREQTVHHYAALFDQAGEDGEAELIGRIGSPTKNAIQLSRGYEPGQVNANLPPLAPPKAPEQDHPTPEPEKPLWEAPPDFEPPALAVEPEEAPFPAEPIAQAVPVEEPAPQPEEPEPAAEAAEPEAEAEGEPIYPAASETEPESEPELPPEETPESLQEPPSPTDTPHKPEPESGEEDQEPWHSEPKAKKPKREKQEKTKKTPSIPEDDEYKPIPRALGVVLLILVMVALGVPIAALLLAAMVVLVLPGTIGLVGAYLAAVGGLWCLSFLADAVLMFGLAFLILALALIVLWVGLWLDFHLILLYVSGVQWLTDELLEREVTADE